MPIKDPAINADAAGHQSGGPREGTEDPNTDSQPDAADSTDIRQALRNILRASAQLHAEELLDAEEVHRRQVLATFGLAMYYAQCLEVQISMMVAAYSPEFAETPLDARDALFDTELERTLGRLARDLGSRAGLPRSLKDKLQKAVRLRNWLAHSYFWEQHRNLSSQEGREQMIAELEEAATFLRSVDRVFTGIMANHMFDDDARATLERETAKLSTE